MREWLSKLKTALTRRRGLEGDLREEIAAHIECAAQEYVERGMNPEAARAAARRHFGNPTLAGERAQQAWTFSAWETILQEARHALRGIRRSPGFSLVVIATLALGIGANTAIFSAVYAALLKPLPYPSSDRLVWLGESSGKSEGFSVTWLNYQHWLAENHAFEDMSAYEQRHLTLTGQGEPLLARGACVTASFFGMTGLRPAMGRFFDEAEDFRGDPAVVLSRKFWVEKLGGRNNVLGATLDLDGKAYQVIGVAAFDPHFFYRPSDFYLPLGLFHSHEVDRSRHGSIRALGRLKPGVTPAAAQSDLDSIMHRLAQVDPGPESAHRADAVSLREISTSEIRPTLLLLMAAVGLVLAIACANVASLLLARSTARARETAIRAAIGAGRLRLIRPMLMESALLSAFGGAAGVLLAYASLRGLIRIAPGDIPRLSETALNYPALLFATGITILTGLLVALASILASRNLSLVSALQESSQSSTGAKQGKSFRSALVVCEIAVTLVLVFASGLLLRSLIAAQTISPGFAPQRLLAMELILPSSSYKTREAILGFHDRLLENLRALPGVASAATVWSPPSAGDNGDWFYSIPGKPAPAADQVPIALINRADSGYFSTMRIPLREGREFNESDSPTEPPVAIVNQTFARHWWPREAAIGHQIKLGGPYRKGDTLQIVGVAGDVSQLGLDTAPREEIFQPMSQATSPAMVVMIRTSGDPAALIQAVRATVFTTDRNLPIQSLRVFAKSLAATLDRRRFTALLLALFAGLAMTLAAVGIFGLLAYWVSVREKEIAIRMALGARRAVIVNWVGSQALKLTAAGMALGALGAWIASRWVSSLVFGVSPHNPATMIAAAVAVMALAALAAAVPAWRAARVDPVRKLHEA